MLLSTSFCFSFIFSRRLFGQVPKTLEDFHALAQFFEFYNFRRRRNSVLAIAECEKFVASDRLFIFERTEQNLVEKLLSIHQQFFAELEKHGDAKNINLAEILTRSRKSWKHTTFEADRNAGPKKVLT